MNDNYKLLYDKETRLKIELKEEKNKWKNIGHTFKKHWQIYVMILPVFLYFLFFRYFPIQGILIAFKNYSNYSESVGKADWVGIVSFRNILVGENSYEFWQAFRNTFTLSMYGLIFGFPVPIILALLFSEIKSNALRSTTQILTYLPHFLSTVIVTSLILLLFYPTSPGTPAGLFARWFENMGIIEDASKSFLAQPQNFRSVYIISGIWQGAGYGSIVYFAAIMSISPTNYEAARIDGANKLAQIKYVTFPGMAPTLTIMLILRIGQILNVGFEKVILLAGNNYDELRTTAEVLSTFSARLGGLIGTGSSDFLKSIGAASDLFNSLIAMFLVLGANLISRKVSETSLF